MSTPKTHLLPSAEVDYVKLVQLKTEYLNNMSKILLNNYGSMAISESKVPDICESLYNASCNLVNFCQEFASKHPGSDTDKFRSKARGIRMVVKQIIFHSKTPAPTQNEQLSILMQLQMAISVHIIFILNLCNKKQITLSDDKPIFYSLSNSMIRNTKKPKTFNQVINSFLEEIKDFVVSLQNLAKDIKKFGVDKQKFDNTEITSLLCSEQSSNKLEEYNLYQKDKLVLLGTCDKLHSNISELSYSIRSYIDLASTEDEDKRNLRSLLSSFRSTAVHILCILVSYIFYYSYVKKIK